MWEHYRKTFLPMQVLILLITAILYFLAERPWQVVLVAFVVMQVVNVVSAWNGARLRRKLQAESEKSPLEP
jgi:membrane protein implicated in regulation of membrane protease activity